jgi:hypothetical protein
MKTMTDRLRHDIFNSAIRDLGETPCILTAEEKNLLIESLPSGQFIIFESKHYGSHLATEDIHWFSEKDEAYQEHILNAFSSLCKRSYIRHVELCVFELSRHGFKVAQNLADESRQANVA